MSSSNKKPWLLRGSKDLGDSQKALDFVSEDDRVRSIILKSNLRKTMLSKKRIAKRFIHVLFVNKGFDFISPCFCFQELLVRINSRKTLDYFNIAFAWKYTQNISSFPLRMG